MATPKQWQEEVAATAKAIPQTNGPLVFINIFHVPMKVNDAFVAAWKRVAQAFVSAVPPGKAQFKMHESLNPDTQFRYVNYAEWSSAQDYQKAYEKKEVQAALQEFADNEQLRGTVQSWPGFYKVIEQSAPPRASSSSYVAFF